MTKIISKTSKQVETRKKEKVINHISLNMDKESYTFGKKMKSTDWEQYG